MASRSRDWQRIGELFEAALELPPSEREAWLARACPDDAALRSEVAAMLAGHERSGGILDGQAEATAPGGLVGPYQLIHEIGRGGMGVVYQAKDSRLGRLVALKFLPAHLRVDDSTRSRFLVEARAASALDHPNICTIYDIGDTEDGQFYIAMAYYHGRTLAEKIREGSLPVEECVDIAIQAAEGIGRAHESGIVHRDIKPANIMVTERGAVKILDFGIAKLAASDITATQHGALIGTAAYMSPEQMLGQPVDHRTDLWSLGVVVYEMLAAKRPFEGADPGLLRDAILHREPEPVSELRPDVPETLEYILSKALAKDRRERYGGAADLISDLKAIGARPISGFRSPAARLPVLLTSFVGREEELRQLGALLDRVRLITLTGPAGAGKTRLALQAASAAADHFDGGVHFVPLAATTDSALVPAVVAQAVVTSEVPSLSPLEILTRAFSQKSVLLVLDNFEQVVAAAPAVAELLAACPGLKAIVTSRVALRVSGEQEYPVPPMQLPSADSMTDLGALQQCSAIQLFTERAQAVNPAFALTGDNARAVAELCMRLDGLPLAVELAAARIKLFSPHVMLGRLADRLELLKGGPRDRPSRHQTLRQAIAWSYELLNEDEQRLFRCVSAFAGGFTLESVKAVCERPDLVEGVAALVDHNLLRAEQTGGDEPRFVLLETIRAYGLEKLREAGEAEVTHRSHASWFLALAERAEPELTGARQAAWLDRLEKEHDNLRAALDWMLERGEGGMALRIATAIWRFWLVRGHLTEARQRMERVLALPGGEPVARARSLHGLGTIIQNFSSNQEARKLFEQSLMFFRQENDKKGVIDTLNSLSWIACDISEFETARRLAEEARVLSRELGEKRAEAVALNNLGWVANYQGDHAAAREFHNASLALRLDIGDRRGAAFAMCNLALAEKLGGAYGQGELLLEKASEILQEVNDRGLLALCLLVRGWNQREQGQFSRAERTLEQSVRLWREVGIRNGLANALWLAAAVALDQGKPEQASAELEEAQSLCTSFGCPWGMALVLLDRGRLARATNADTARALVLWKESLRILQGIRAKPGMIECLEEMAEAGAAGGDPRMCCLLLAAVEAFRGTAALPRPPRRLQSYEATRELLRHRLGEDSFQRAWEEGLQMPIKRAVAMALSGHDRDIMF